MRALGVDGYTTKAKDLMETTDKLKKGIAEIDVCLLYLSVILCFLFLFFLLNISFQDTVSQTSVCFQTASEELWLFCSPRVSSVDRGLKPKTIILVFSVSQLVGSMKK